VALDLHLYARTAGVERVRISDYVDPAVCTLWRDPVHVVTHRLEQRRNEFLEVRLRLLPNVEVYIWRPSDWDELVEVLTRR
jgi:hypothetical protein